MWRAWLSSGGRKLHPDVIVVLFASWGALRVPRQLELLDFFLILGLHTMARSYYSRKTD
jgi:hypothetical protein